MEAMNLFQEQKRSSNSENHNPEITRQRSLAIHGIACLLAHSELKGIQGLNAKPTYGAIMEHDPMLRLESNRCLAKMIASFGLESAEILMKIAKSFGAADTEVMQEANKIKKSILISFCGGEDVYKKIFAGEG